MAQKARKGRQQQKKRRKKMGQEQGSARGTMSGLRGGTRGFFGNDYLWGAVAVAGLVFLARQCGLF